MDNKIFYIIPIIIGFAGLLSGRQWAIRVIEFQTKTMHYTMNRFEVKVTPIIIYIVCVVLIGSGIYNLMRGLL